MSVSFEQVFPLRPPLPLPEGVAENNLFEWLKHVCVEDAPKQEMFPAQVLREIRRVLKPNGQLILTTPNVARLENIARLLSGANIYFVRAISNGIDTGKKPSWLYRSYAANELD